MAERVRKYVVPPQAVEDFNTAYAALQVAEDIDEKLRNAGRPDPEREAKTRQMRETLERTAAAFDIKLETG